MDESTIDAVHRLLGEIAESKAKVKTTREQIEQILDQNDDYKQLKDELKTLTTKRSEMKQVLNDDKDYRQFAEELDELKFKLKDLQEILSHHLVSIVDSSIW